MPNHQLRSKRSCLEVVVRSCVLGCVLAPPFIVHATDDVSAAEVRAIARKRTSTASRVRHVLLLKLFTSIFAQFRGIGRTLQEYKEVFWSIGLGLSSGEACQEKRKDKKQVAGPDFIHLEIAVQAGIVQRFEERVSTLRTYYIVNADLKPALEKVLAEILAEKR